MPATKVFFYCDPGGESPVLDWLGRLRGSNLRAFNACRARVVLLAALGHELRRPHADHLRNGIYELRARCGRVNYRLLYFFHGKDVAVVAHGFTKEAEVPDVEIERAIQRKVSYEQSPGAHRAAADL